MCDITSKSGLSLGLVYGMLALCCGLGTCHESFASEPIRIFGVAVYLDRFSPCTTAAVDSVTVTVSPFKEQVNLGDLVTELARKAAESHANVVYEIKLISFVPNEGAVATAMVSTCLHPNPTTRDNQPPFNPDLADLVNRAQDVRPYLFTDRVPALQRSVQTSARVQRNFGSADAVSRLRRLIFADDTYVSTSGAKLDKSCPFVPSFGFEFREGNSSAWWLVSELCETAILIAPEKYWLEGIRDLKPESVAAFRQLIEPPK